MFKIKPITLSVALLRLKHLIITVADSDVNYNNHEAIVVSNCTNINELVNCMYINFQMLHSSTQSLWDSLRQLMRFLLRDAMLARYMMSSCVCPSVCPSGCLSDTSWHCTKTAKRMIMQKTPYDSA